MPLGQGSAYADGFWLTLREQYRGTGFGLWPRCANDAVTHRLIADS
ncbi:MAG: hypothetical protein F6K26_04000 [Moorea sp. SIO2I5]|nr:hypothetical protein [Moorena sp. SIO2I5]